MSVLCYRRGDATRPRVEGPKVIAHLCNDLGRWGKGFEKALTTRYPQAEKAYKTWAEHGTWEGQPFALGSLQLVDIPQTNVTVVNLIAQRGVKTKDGVPPLRYEALEAALPQLRTIVEERDASLHMPRIGVGPAGGDWTLIERLLQKYLGELHVFIYDVNKR